MFENIRIVLIQPSHPGNIGATARAMKTMGLSRLYLVKPRVFPSIEATARAASAADVLENATVCDNLVEAIADCKMVFGSGSEKRNKLWPLVTPRQMGESIVKEHGQHEVAIVFGRESLGMSNEEMQHCHAQIQIPSNPEYPSLNLAAAIQVVTYELRMAALSSQPDSPVESNRVGVAEMESFYGHLETTMLDLGFHNVNTPRSLMSRLRRVFNAAELSKQDIDLLRGFLAAVQKQVV